MKKHLLAIFLAFNIYAFSSTPESTPDITKASEETAPLTPEKNAFLIRLFMFLNKAFKDKNVSITFTDTEICLETKDPAAWLSSNSDRVCIPSAAALSLLHQQGLSILNDLDPKELDGLHIDISQKK